MIKFFDFKKEYPQIKEELEAAFKRVLESGVFIGGREVKDFEKKMAEFLKVKYALGVNSGTDALFLSLKALGIKEEDEVITTPFTFISTAEVIANLGAKPVFADIEEDFNISPKEIEKKITSKTKALIPVHLFGLPAKIDKILEIAKKNNLFVIEDAAQSFGAGEIGKGDISCFSFFPTKILGTLGDGGMVATNNRELAEEIKLLRNHGSSLENKYKNLVLGTNSRLDSLQAAFLKVKMDYLGKWIGERKEIARRYSEGLKDLKEIKTPIFDDDHVFNCYTIRAERRDELKDYLEETGIETKIYYPLPLYSQPALNFLKVDKNEFTQTEKAVKEVLSLPIYSRLAKRDQIFIVNKIKEFYS